VREGLAGSLRTAYPQPVSEPTLPSRARVVIIGGGAIGTSIAYHLGHEGITDVVLLERDRLTSGTTWHAAGLMTAFGNTSSTSTEIRMYTRDLFPRLEAETGMSTGFRRCGLVEALDESRMEEYRRAAIFQRRLGLESHEVSPKEMEELFPFAQMDGLVGGFWVPGDGRVNPVDLTMAYAKGARNLGVRIIEGVSVEIGPQHVGEIEFGVGELPEQEVADPLLTAGADEEVGLGRVGHHQVRRKIGLAVAAGLFRMRQGQLVHGLKDVPATAVIGGDGQRQARVIGGLRLAFADQRNQARLERGKIADHLEAHAVGMQLADFALQGADEKIHQK